MNKIAPVFSTLLIFAFSIYCSAQPRLTDRELDGLKGKVEKASDGWETKTYDREGYLVKIELQGGNCFINYAFTYTNPVKTERTMKATIHDFSNSGFCSMQFESLSKKNGAVVYILSRSDAYSSYKNENSNHWLSSETGAVENKLQWRKTRLYDAKSRLLEVLYITSNLIAETIVYNYVGNDSEPDSAEFITNNRFSCKYWYKYDERDKHGNWTIRTPVKVEPASRGGLEETKRNITYYAN